MGGQKYQLWMSEELARGVQVALLAHELTY